MKRFNKILFTLLFLTGISLITVSAQGTTESAGNTKVGKLQIKLAHIESDDGVIMLAVYQGEQNYNKSHAFKAAKVVINNGSAEYTFKDVPFGEYAVKCYHDENENGKLDTNMLGIPSEGYGFSNNATGSFGPAEYEDAKFEFKEDGQTFSISMQ